MTPNRPNKVLDDDEHGMLLVAVQPIVLSSRLPSKSRVRWKPLGVLVVLSLLTLFFAKRLPEADDGSKSSDVSLRRNSTGNSTKGTSALPPRGVPDTVIERPDNSSSSKDNPTVPNNTRPRVAFSCPENIPIAVNANTEENWYDEPSRQIMKNLSEFLTFFRQAPEFDNWGHTYGEVKKGMFRWKSKHFDIPDNSTMFESACGIGLNLFMTLEIMAEVFGLHSIEVYGNEYVPASVEVARTIASHHSFPGKLGTICRGDSTSTAFVPSNSFDLVYTGYVSPLQDPLGFNLSNEELFGRYTELCEAKDAKGQSQNKRAQHLQEQWYGAWVGEMIRIAKPNAPIIVEQVSYPLCEAYYDWGGVAQTFWRRAISRFGWDVSADSFEMEDDMIFRHRYHVFMRKNGPSSEEAHR